MITEGLFSDSCFKIESRGTGTNYRHSYYYRIRKVSKEYLGFDLKPKNLYISGIMNRIKITLESKGFDLQYAFIEHKRTSTPLIQPKLVNSRCDMGTNYLRQMINGRINEFE